MQPTLEPDQRLIVNRLTPHFDPYKPGDIIVFDDPTHPDSGAPLIKRVIALEGSAVEIADGRVFVDGLAVDEPYTFDSEPTLSRSGQTRWIVRAGQLFSATTSPYPSTRGRSVPSRSHP